jgi:DNA-binding NtrC family response regulator
VPRRKDRPADPPTRSLVSRASQSRLVVLGGEVLASYPLPARGTVVIGRGAECDVRIEDPSISRRHARLELGTVTTIEDLGSSNGTLVAGARIAHGQAVEVRFDEVLAIGGVGVVIQRAPTATRQRTLWGHGYFELRLGEECTRAGRTGASFGLLRVRSTAADAVEQLGTAVRDVDVIGTYAPGEWEVLVVDATAEAVARLADAVRAVVPASKVAAAMFPADGGDAWSLAAAAAGRFIDGARPPTTDAPIVLGGGAQVTALLDLVTRVAVGDISVLILGETGVGKEIVAELLHQRSRRAGRPLLRLSCAAVPEALIESELFGHEKGAFTGAAAAKQGLLEQAAGGSVFLDEIGELPASTQVKLLRVLEQREILRVGALRPLALDVRFIAATHRDLETAIAAGRFREDLYFRLAGVTLSVPPLRERRDEIEPLVQHFAARAAAALGRPTPRVTPAALALLRTYRWPGNIRELRNVIDRATLLCDGEIDVRHLPDDRMTRPAAAAPSESAGLDGVRDQARELERQAIELALAKTGGNQTAAARLLGISRRALTTKLTQHGFERPRKRT